ncbi:MAG: hydantoinase/oxoprolinase family protein [Eubacterium sp.]|nr:hydantoinase/oxoprolinase family protein [Eubacterium sp.]
MIGIGIDTGGTCTDTVVYDLDEKKVLAYGKANTTHEQLEIGIRDSLRTISREWMEKASYISLSTTLATNAAVENKGGRVSLIFIGVEEKTVKDTYENYGFDGTDFMYFIPGDAMKKEEPNWDEVKAQIPAMVDGYDGVAISQLFARSNGGEYEKKLKEMITEYCDLPVVCAYEIFKDLNAVKRGAGALLNARLIPVIDEFFTAVQNVLDEEQISLPFVIMRSDGSLVSAEYSRRYPVETLLCGPTASAKGGKELFVKNDGNTLENAIVIDMGGTTSDIALIKDAEPVIDEDGVKVGKWETFVRGIAIDTFALGGDTHVMYKNDQLLLGNRRVMPISQLATKYPKVMEGLLQCNMMPHGSTRFLHEHFLLMNGEKCLDAKEQYTESEVAICEALKDGPLSHQQLAAIVGKDAFLLKTERLEDEGIILRCGFTPTDAMVLKGDFELGRVGYKAAKEACEFMAKSMGIDETTDYQTEIPARVYELVQERLYCNLVRILWMDTREGKIEEEELTHLEALARDSFYAEKEGSEGVSFFKNVFATDAKLLGVGAPTHVFLDGVAKALHTKGLLSEYSGVSNALGALLGDVCVYESVFVKANYLISDYDEEGQEFYLEGEGLRFETPEEAVEAAKNLALERAKERAVSCGAGEVYDASVKVKEQSGSTNNGEIYLGAEVIACARGKLKLETPAHA